MWLTHLDENGSVRMVGVGKKSATHRVALASARVLLKPATLRMIQARKIAKGNVLEVAKVAGISAAKETSRLIPLCHPLALTKIDLELDIIEPDAIAIKSRVEAIDRTGVEMEALTSVAVACLTIYDMCKSADKEITITDIRLEEKLGGKSGHFKRSRNCKRL